jgi:nitroreductase
MTHMDDRKLAKRAIDAVIRSRRTSMFTESRDIDPSIVAELCELASWAPCHKRTWPWQFALLTGQARERFGARIAYAMHGAGDEPARVEKARTKYLRTPAILVVASGQGDTQLRTVENRDATAAAIQNILLGATARGLASFWSSCPRGCNDTVVEFCGFSESASIVGIVYLGHATQSAEAPPRPEPPLSMITS